MTQTLKKAFDLFLALAAILFVLSLIIPNMKWEQKVAYSKDQISQISFLSPSSGS